MEGFEAGEPVAILVGVALVALGAVGASVTQRRFESTGRAGLLVVALAPFGVLVGAGAALVRGWSLWGSVITGLVLVPLVGVGSRLLEVRRRRRDRG